LNQIKTLGNQPMVWDRFRASQKATCHQASIDEASVRLFVYFFYTLKGLYVFVTADGILFASISTKAPQFFRNQFLRKQYAAPHYPFIACTGGFARYTRVYLSS
jgi:hypothetical protein